MEAKFGKAFGSDKIDFQNPYVLQGAYRNQ